LSKQFYICNDKNEWVCSSSLIMVPCPLKIELCVTWKTDSPDVIWIPWFGYTFKIMRRVWNCEKDFYTRKNKWAAFITFSRELNWTHTNDCFYSRKSLNVYLSVLCYSEIWQIKTMKSTHFFMAQKSNYREQFQISSFL
jgi:hypothetical protein